MRWKIYGRLLFYQTEQKIKADSDGMKYPYWSIDIFLKILNQYNITFNLTIGIYIRKLLSEQENGIQTEK